MLLEVHPLFVTCFRYGQDDFRNNQINEVAVIGLPQGTYEPIETDFSAIAV